MELSTVILSENCKHCEYKTNLPLSNPICMSCDYCKVTTKHHNFSLKSEIKKREKLN